MARPGQLRAKNVTKSRNWQSNTYNVLDFEENEILFNLATSLIECMREPQIIDAYVCSLKV